MWIASLPPASQTDNDEEESQIIRLGRPPVPSRLEATEAEYELLPPTPVCGQAPLGFIDSTFVLLSETKDELLTTGCQKLDNFLQGGILCRGLTEIYGCSGTAKTQLCLQLALSVHLPYELGGLEADAFYITTEGGFPTKRLKELAEQFSIKYGFGNQQNPLDHIVIEVTPDRDSLFHCLNVRIQSLMMEKRRNKIRLIIVDSLAAIFRSEYDGNDGDRRTADLRSVALTLQKLSRDLKAAVIVVNQATACFQTGKTIPSLGLVWTNMVATRLQLSRKSTVYEGVVEGSDRSLEVVFSPRIPRGSIGIEVSSQGLYANSNPVYVRDDDTRS